MFSKQLGYDKASPTPIYIYDLPSLQMINDNSSSTYRMRHINILYFAVQYWRIDGSIITVHIKGILNPSDDLTKPLNWRKNSQN